MIATKDVDIGCLVILTFHFIVSSIGVENKQQTYILLSIYTHSVMHSFNPHMRQYYVSEHVGERYHRENY